MASNQAGNPAAALPRPIPAGRQTAREGTMVVDAASGEVLGGTLQQVYVYEAPGRIWHWVMMIAMIELAATGYLIGSQGSGPPREATFTSKGGRKKNKFRGEGDEDESKKVEVHGETKFAQDFYPKSENPPTPRMRLPKFGENPKIRIQEAGPVWSLIVLPDFKGMEGWVESKFISPLP